MFIIMTLVLMTPKKKTKNTKQNKITDNRISNLNTKTIKDYWPACEYGNRQTTNLAKNKNKTEKQL